MIDASALLLAEESICSAADDAHSLIIAFLKDNKKNQCNTNENINRCYDDCDYIHIRCLRVQIHILSLNPFNSNTPVRTLQVALIRYYTAIIHYFLSNLLNLITL